MDNNTINVTDTSAITVEAGGFRIYGNKVASLAIAYEGASGFICTLIQLLIIYFKYKYH
jgi:hypothetical protein